MKPAATKAAILLRLKLSALASRGVAGEADAAQAKLARLEARYDFSRSSEPAGQQKGDIFAGLGFNIRSRTARHLATFAPAECDLASFCQWAIAKGAGVETSLRQSPDAELCEHGGRDAPANTGGVNPP